MANPYDFEGLYGLDPAMAQRLRSKFDPMAGSPVAPDPDSPEAWAAAGARAPVSTEGGVPRYDLSQTLAPEERAEIAASGAPGAKGPAVQFNAFGGPSDPPPPVTPAAPEMVGQGQAQPQMAPQAGGAAPVVIPGGWRPNTSETSVKQTGTPEDRERVATALQSSAGYGIEGANQRLAAAKMDIDTDLKEAEMRRAASAQYDAALARNAAARQAYVDEGKAKLSKLSEELAKDPTTQYWATKDDGQKVMSFVGVLLSGIGAGLAGGPNLALQKIDNEINRGLANRRDNFARQKTAYNEALAEYGDRAVAIQAAKIASYEKVAQDLAPLRANAKTAKAQADWEDINRGVMERVAKGYEDLGVHLGTQYEEKNTEKFRDPQVVGGASAKPLENTATLSDGTTVQFQNSEQGNKAVEKIQAHSKVQALLGTAQKLREEVASLTPGTAAHEAKYNQLEKLVTDITYEESIARGQGVVKEDEMQRAMKTSPLLQGLGSRGVTGGVVNAVNPFKSRDYEAGNKGIAAALKQSETEQYALVRGAGGRIVQKGYTTDAAGNLAPTGRYTGQDVQPQQVLAPQGFKPHDDRKDIPTAARALAETTPAAPRMAPRKK